MIDILVIAMAVVVVLAVVIGRRTKSVRQRSGRDAVLAALAPVVGGSVSGERVLSGIFRGCDVQVSLRSADPAVPGGPGVSSQRYLVEVLRVRLVGAVGGQPWSVWRSPTLTGTTWHFARSDGSGFLPFAGRLGRLAGIPETDADLPDRLRAAGILAAFERLGPPTKDSFPHVRFMPDLRPQMLARVRASGRPLPTPDGEAWSSAGSWLEVEVERSDDGDPTPDRFRAILDATLEIAEINARTNPVAGTS